MKLSTIQIVSLVLTIVLGILVLISYIPIGRRQIGGSFDYWLGLSMSLRPYLYVLMAIAAAGFIMMMVDYLTSPPPTDGLFAKHEAVFPVIVSVCLTASALWSVFVLQYSQATQQAHRRGWAAATSTTLVVAALCSILLIAGQVEKSNTSISGFVGSILFGLVVVLVDGVGWNSRLLIQNK